MALRCPSKAGSPCWTAPPCVAWPGLAWPSSLGPTSPPSLPAVTALPALWHLEGAMFSPAMGPATLVGIFTWNMPLFHLLVSAYLPDLSSKGKPSPAPSATPHGRPPLSLVLTGCLCDVGTRACLPPVRKRHQAGPPPHSWACAQHGLVAGASVPSLSHRSSVQPPSPLRPQALPGDLG